MYAYPIIERHEEKFDRYLFVVDSEKDPLSSYLVIITIKNHKIMCSCSCKGYAIRGKCKHIQATFKKIIQYRLSHSNTYSK